MVAKKKKKKDKPLTKKQLKKIARREDKKKLKEWSLAVKERDERKCVVCGESHMLNAHHIIPKEIKELKFDVNNGISLCPKHHKYSFQFSAHRNGLAFIAWLQKNREWQYSYLLKYIEQPGLL